MIEPSPGLNPIPSIASIGGNTPSSSLASGSDFSTALTVLINGTGPAAGAKETRIDRQTIAAPGKIAPLPVADASALGLTDQPDNLEPGSALVATSPTVNQMEPHADPLLAWLIAPAPAAPSLPAISPTQPGSSPAFDKTAADLRRMLDARFAPSSSAPSDILVGENPTKVPKPTKADDDTREDEPRDDPGNDPATQVAAVFPVMIPIVLPTPVAKPAVRPPAGVEVISRESVLPGIAQREQRGLMVAEPDDGRPAPPSVSAAQSVVAPIRSDPPPPAAPTTRGTAGNDPRGFDLADVAIETPAVAAQQDRAIPAAVLMPRPARQAELSLIADIVRPRRQSGDTVPAEPVVNTAMATAPIAPAPVDANAQAGIGLTRDPGLHRMIDRIETLRDAADARDTRIRLIPDALGLVDIAVRRDGDAVRIHFTAADPATRQLIADAQPRLNELAENRGVRIERATIDGGAAGDGGMGHPRPQAQPAALSLTPTSVVKADQSQSTDDRIA